MKQLNSLQDSVGSDSNIESSQALSSVRDNKLKSSHDSLGSAKKNKLGTSGSLEESASYDEDFESVHMSSSGKVKKPAIKEIDSYKESSDDYDSGQFESIS